jgi:hypothetical protein
MNEHETDFEKISFDELVSVTASLLDSRVFATGEYEYPYMPHSDERANFLEEDDIGACEIGSGDFDPQGLGIVSDIARAQGYSLSDLHDAVVERLGIVNYAKMDLQDILHICVEEIVPKIVDKHGQDCVLDEILSQEMFRSREGCRLSVRDVLCVNGISREAFLEALEEEL